MFKKVKKAPDKRLKVLCLEEKIKCLKVRIEETYPVEKKNAGPIKDIIKHLKNLFQRKDVKKIDIILLVWGFFECLLL